MTPKTSTILYGGSFNPFGFHHRECVEYLITLGEVWVVPSAGHPEKEILVPFDIRCQMVRKTLAGIPASISNLDLVYQTRGEGPSYTYKVLKMAQELYPDRKFKFAVGADCAKALPKWAFGEELLAEFEVVIIPFESPVRSTTIREDIASGGSAWRKLVGPGTQSIIDELGLYKEG